MESEEETQTTKTTERRVSDDFWYYFAKGLAVLCWILFILALGISFYAAPEKSYGVLRYRNIEIRQFWLTPLTSYLYLIIWASAAASYASMLIEKYRGRRHNDHAHYNLYFILIINIIWLSVILYHALNP